MIKVIVAHPGKQHSFQLATALTKAGILDKYVTTVYLKPKSLTSILLKLAKGDLGKKISTRKCETLKDNDVKTFNELGVIMTLFLKRLPFHKISEYWNLFIESSFYRKLMKYALKRAPEAIVIYNGYAKKHLDMLSGKQIVKIMDVSIAQRDYLREVLQQEIEETGISQIKEDHFSYWNEVMVANDREGCNNIDYFLAPSQFVKNSLLAAGIKDWQIKIVPYGVNVSQFTPKSNKDYGGRLKLLYVGSVSYRKGMHRLLKIVAKSTDVDLFIAGGYNSASELYIEYKDAKNMHFLGFVTRDKLNALYNDCHVFVLPSLCEGMAMVGLEAMAAGLPIICSKNTGVNDVVVNGINGYVYNYNDEAALLQYINIFKQDRDSISRMATKARITALQYSWENYHKRVAKVIEECINER